MPPVEKGSKSSAKKPSVSKAKEGKEAKKDASSKSKANQKQLVQAKKPAKTTPAKGPKENSQKKVHNTASSEGKKGATGKPKSTEKQPRKVKTTPAKAVKDERRKAEKRPFRTEAEKEAMRQDEDARRIVVRGCPLNVAKGEVERTFPTAEKVWMVNNKGHFNGVCLITFATKSEATEEAKRKDVTIAGQAVEIYTPEDMGAFHQDKAAREVVLLNCPSTTKEEDVKEAFPQAEKVNLANKFGRFNGTCFVTFATSDEANTALQRTDVTIAGQAVEVRKRVEKEALIEDERKREIMLVDCPYGMVEDDVREVFPTAQRVHMVRHFTGKCFVVFDTREEAVAASQKKEVTIKDKTVRLLLRGQTADGKSIEEVRKLEVVLDGCPYETKKKDVEAIFPNAKRVYMMKKGGWFSRKCIVQFNSNQEAVTASKKTDFTIHERPVYVSLHDDEENPPAKRRKVAA